MKEWNDPSVKTPEEGELVEVRLAGGRCVKPVQFAAERFWKVRQGNGGQAYTVDKWRGIDAPKKAEPVKKAGARVEADGGY